MSPNVLLGSGVQPEEEKPLPPVYKRAPAWRFHKDFPDRVCKTDEELDKLDAEGWVDKPGKARRLPGHEKIYDEYNAVKEEKPSEIVTPNKEKTEDEIRADILKTESDKVEANRLEDIRKAEEKRLKEEQKEEGKCLKDEREAEEKRLKEYEAAKNPPGPRICTLCGKVFDSIRALNMHGIGAHRNKE